MLELILSLLLTVFKRSMFLYPRGLRILISVVAVVVKIIWNIESNACL